MHFARRWKKITRYFGISKPYRRYFLWWGLSRACSYWVFLYKLIISRDADDFVRRIFFFWVLLRIYTHIYARGNTHSQYCIRRRAFLLSHNIRSTYLQRECIISSCEILNNSDKSHTIPTVRVHLLNDDTYVRLFTSIWNFLSRTRKP